MARIMSIALAAGVLAGLAVPAVAQTKPSPKAPLAVDAPVTTQGKLLKRTPLPAAAAASLRQPRVFHRCNREALNRRLRGAQRRSFVEKCRLGFGFRLFRLRRPTVASH